jgi:hypothetical protein
LVLSAVGSLLGLGGGAPPAVRRPSFKVAFGRGGSDAWQNSVVAMTVTTGLAPQVNVAEIYIVDASSAPQVSVGDSGGVALGYDDSPPVTVLTGQVIAVRYGLDGITRVTAADSGAQLAALRINQTYEQQSAGDIANDLAGRAGIDTDTVENGIQFPFYVLDDRRGAYVHLAALARACGFLAYMTVESKLAFGPYLAGQPAQTFGYGDDLIALELAQTGSSAGAITVYGEGAAGSKGQAAWSWLVKDPSVVTGNAGSGTPERASVDHGLRSADAVGSAARGMSAAAAQLTLCGRLVVPGAPAVGVGTTVSVKGGPQQRMDGDYLVRGVQHQFSRGGGFTTVLLIAQAAGAGRELEI